MKVALLVSALLLVSLDAQASTGLSNGVSGTAISLFLLVILMTLGITWWSAQRTKSAQDFYAAGGKITGRQNGLAIAGDAMSAGAFLGLTAYVFNSGFDGLVYVIGYTTGLPIVLFLLAGKLRKLGRYTFTDVVCTRLKERPTRIFSACASLIIVAFYLVAQMVGAGQLIQLLFGIDYVYAISLVGILMVLYVMFGGMVATTWVQIIKAVLMLSGGVLMCILVMSTFGFSFSALLDQAVSVHPAAKGILTPGALPKDPVSAISLGVAMILGIAGLPHILMRFFTVPDSRTARSSVLWATIFMGSFYSMLFIIGFGALALLRTSPQYFDGAGALLGGSNMAAIHLAHLLGGDVLMGLVSAIAFATILAVVAGLTISGAAAISHDIYGSLFKHKGEKEAKELLILKISTLVLGVIAVLLGIVFRSQNVAYMISLAYSIACSSTFPVLLLAIYWSRLTTFGAILGGSTGLVGSLVLTILGPSIWVKVLGHAAPIFSIDPPAIITVPLAFVVCIVASLCVGAKVEAPAKSLA
jgi:cation/acetate symporter